MRINGQFGRSVLGISIGFAMVGALSLPVAAQSTSLLFPHIQHTGSGETFALAKQPPPPVTHEWGTRRTMVELWEIAFKILKRLHFIIGQ